MASLLLLACAGERPERAMLDMRGYPSSWPRPLQVFQGDESCYELDGKYSSGGVSNSDIGERFSNPIFERSFFNKTQIADESNYFTVRLDETSKEIGFEIYNKLGDKLESDLRKKFAACENGWLVVDFFSKGGSGDSPVRSTYGRISYGLAADGSLLINSYSQVESGKWFIGSETKSSDIWYRYVPTE